MQKLCFFIPEERGRMGEPNAALNVYMSKKERIRDVVEYYMGGRIPAGYEISTEDGFYSLRDKGKLTFRERDELKKVQLKEGKGFLLGIENQMTVNLTFPQRLLEMDSLEYRRQVDEITEKNRQAGIKYSAEDDFKYRFRKKDRLRPVCSLKLYWGKEKEHMPVSLGDMMDMEGMPEQMRHLFNDYRVHTVCMRFIPDEDLEKMSSDMKYVIGVLKRTERGNNYQQFILEHADYFGRMPADAYEVIRVCANIKEIKKEFTFHEDDGEERVDMCRAIYEIKRDAKREGKREGKKEGRREGRCEAILELLEGCGEVPEETKKLIFKEKNTEKLGMWLRLAAKAESIEEFYMAM